MILMLFLSFNSQWWRVLQCFSNSVLHKNRKSPETRTCQRSLGILIHTVDKNSYYI